jgi:membrane protein DedA with SNARE-associated domain/rhodanese-related sulfurtransferase
MEHLVALFTQHGLLAVFLGVLCEQIGAPLPSVPLLLLAGVQSADGRMSALQALAVATTAAMLANMAWFVAGRLLGRRVLATLCRISISPDTCVRQNELSFARRGVLTLLTAKFVPGLSVLAPPLAGALGMRWRTFLAFNLAGSLLWAGVGIGVGRVFHAQIDRLLSALNGLGQVALAVGLALLGGYIAWRLWWRWRTQRALSRFERIGSAELAALLDARQDVLVVDVRASSPGLPLPSRIPGARHLDLARLESDAIAAWPATSELVTYCACPNDASAVKAAQWLATQGRRSRVLAGGIQAWTQAGFALEDSRDGC